MTYDIEINGRTRRLEISRSKESVVVTVDGRRQPVDVRAVGGVWSLILESDEGRRSYELAIEKAADGDLRVHFAGRVVEARVASGRGAWARGGEAKGAAGATGPHRILAPMPGRVVKLLVRAGDSVVARQGLVVVEAMKMENELRAPRAGVVIEIRVREGTPVEAGAVLVIVE